MIDPAVVDDAWQPPGAMRDPDGLNLLLMSELARLSPKMAAVIVEPCLCGVQRL